MQATSQSTHEVKPSTGMTLLAFAIIYFVWGSTFLAIRIGVLQVPPLLFAAMRFFIAGLALYGWTMIRGEPSPIGRQWLSVLLLGFIIFGIDYGCLFWAEQRVASGVAAILLATIPAFMALSEILLLRTQRLTFRLALALLVGLCGVAVLVSRTLKVGGAPVDRGAAIAVMVGAISWSVASVLTRKLPLPASKSVSSGTQMLLGGVVLGLASAIRGELHGFHPTAVSFGAWLALAYLVVFGSIIGFTAYLWLIHHQSPTKVGTYAYVNPVVAVLLGYFAGGEPLGPRTILGALCVLLSVVLITTARTAQPRPAAPMAKPESIAQPE
jgi:drug/metabolite transporter (DMT)-like permease